jgi:hypothetical protein
MIFVAGGGITSAYSQSSNVTSSKAATPSGIQRTGII